VRNQHLVVGHTFGSSEDVTAGASRFEPLGPLGAFGRQVKQGLSAADVCPFTYDRARLSAMAGGAPESLDRMKSWDLWMSLWILFPRSDGVTGRASVRLGRTEAFDPNLHEPTSARCGRGLDHRRGRRRYDSEC